MNKQKDSKHISIWIPNSLLKECNINQIRYEVKTRSEYVIKALEFYNSYLFSKQVSGYINVEIMNRLEAMLDSLENRIGRQMFKLIVESAKICRILFDHLELDITDIIGTTTKKTDYVIVGEKAGSKLQKALNLGIRTLTEDEFEDMLTANN